MEQIACRGVRTKGTNCVSWVQGMTESSNCPARQRPSSFDELKAGIVVPVFNLPCNHMNEQRAGDPSPADVYDYSPPDWVSRINTTRA